MSWGIAGLLPSLIGPPGGFILLILLGLLLLAVRKKTGITFISSGVILLYVCSMPVTANWLINLIESPSTIGTEELATPRAEAIVILGGGRREHAPEFTLPTQEGDTISSATLERIRYGAWLAKRMQLPILVTGGLPDVDSPAEAVLMKQAIEDEYSIPVRWVEVDSRNTYENAKFSTIILKADGIKKIYLVTHANHMPRSVWSFNQFGLEIYPAPTAYYGGTSVDVGLKDFLPSAGALGVVSTVFHEVVGSVWYWLRY